MGIEREIKLALPANHVSTVVVAHMAQASEKPPGGLSSQRAESTAVQTEGKIERGG